MLQGQRRPDRLDLVTRALKLKLDAVKDDIVKNEILGKVRALTYVIEYQKQGLPHAHMTAKITEESIPKRLEPYDKFVSAKLPDLTSYPQLYETIPKNMIHGPCGGTHPESSVAFVRKGTIMISEHAQRVWIAAMLAAQSRDNNATKEGEAGQSMRPDRATISVETPVTDVSDSAARRVDINEVKDYLTVRYICPPEECWRLLKYPM
ncbi:LOW QUALITY PROTEIN: Helitron helicase [Phytophthora megakarya]|uniref:Helitron helicase n=1 Tax=Phytophthora megakarya TaxID=4795 RepID=A0A225WQU3_9STRA|nr:LOW QUALITY PROTEIN: Helitron helicase [Phytophthora megakarya]